MLDLFQAEWCPSSARVRQRLTELGIDYVIHQVPVERQARGVLRDAVGALTIPALRLENGSAIVGEENILACLGEHIVESPEAEAHRRRAAITRRRYLEDECECSQVDARQSRRERAVERTRFQIQGRQGGGGSGI
jgi:glutaredoxin